ncbi:hypothetical protein HWV62_26015 [Athelia sp. TMB]|nr:hypothetical protein HWV62_26015 [Athelia sp. TMB]
MDQTVHDGNQLGSHQGHPERTDQAPPQRTEVVDMTADQLLELAILQPTSELEWHEAKLLSAATQTIYQAAERAKQRSRHLLAHVESELRIMREDSINTGIVVLREVRDQYRSWNFVLPVPPSSTISSEHNPHQPLTSSWLRFPPSMSDTQPTSHDPQAVSAPTSETSGGLPMETAPASYVTIQAMTSPNAMNVGGRPATSIVPHALSGLWQSFNDAPEATPTQFTPRASGSNVAYSGGQPRRSEVRISRPLASVTERLHPPIPDHFSPQTWTFDKQPSSSSTSDIKVPQLPTPDYGDTTTPTALHPEDDSPYRSWGAHNELMTIQNELTRDAQVMGFVNYTMQQQQQQSWNYSQEESSPQWSSSSSNQPNQYPYPDQPNWDAGSSSQQQWSGPSGQEPSDQSE